MRFDHLGEAKIFESKKVVEKIKKEEETKKEERKCKKEAEEKERKVKKLEEAIDRLMKKNKERGSSSFKLVKMKEVENSPRNAAAAKFAHPVADLDLSKVTILNKRNYMKPELKKEKVGQLKMNIATIEEECGTDKEEDNNLVASQKYFADLDPTPSNIKTSVLEGCGSSSRLGPLLSFRKTSSQSNTSHHMVAEDILTKANRDGSLPSEETLTEGVVIQGPEKLEFEEQVVRKESSRSKRDLRELAKRMREEVGARVNEKEGGHVHQTVKKVLQSPSIHQVSFFSDLDYWPDFNIAFLAAPGQVTSREQGGHFELGFKFLPCPGGGGRSYRPGARYTPGECTAAGHDQAADGQSGCIMLFDGFVM